MLSILTLLEIETIKSFIHILIYTAINDRFTETTFFTLLLKKLHLFLILNRTKKNLIKLHTNDTLFLELLKIHYTHIVKRNFTRKLIN